MVIVVIVVTLLMIQIFLLTIIKGKQESQKSTTLTLQKIIMIEKMSLNVWVQKTPQEKIKWPVFLTKLRKLIFLMKGM